MVIKSVGVMSVAKVLGAMYATIGLIFGLFISLAAMVGGLASMQSELGMEGGMMGALFGVGAIVLLPAIYGSMGFIIGAIAGLIYNIFAGIVGGIRIEVQQ